MCVAMILCEGYTQIDCEVPIQKREASVAEFNWIIDLLATGPKKCLILDHKSSSGSFSDYFTQIQLYRHMINGTKISGITQIGINWVDLRTVEVSSD
jgi:ATP-dependent helicase/nuclease subunit A